MAITIDGNSTLVTTARTGVNESACLEGTWGSPLLPPATHLLQIEKRSVDGSVPLSSLVYIVLYSLRV
jgi:hypothetical protein